MNYRALVGNDRYGMGMQTSGCIKCGLLQTWPRPTSASMAEFYRERYREYYQAAVKPDKQYATRFHKDERLSYTARLIGSSVTLVGGMRVLDVGCAEGTLFAKMGGEGSAIRFVGIEPSEGFAAYARETTGCVTYPDIDALSAADESAFDLIVVNHVLEHVDDPVRFLRRLAGSLAPSGKIYVDVPNADCYTSPESLHIAHLFHFTPRTLAATIFGAGLHVVSSACHRPPHHPPSAWVLAEQRFGGGDVRTSAEGEAVSWAAMLRLNRLLPFYLWAARLRRSGLGKHLDGMFRSARKVLIRDERPAG